MNGDCVCLLVISCILFQATAEQDYGLPGESIFIRSGFEKYNGIKSFFGEIPDDEIAALAYHDDLKISVIAAWIECKRRCKNIDSGTIDDSKILHEFVGFISGRLNIPVPEWWRVEIVKLGLLEGTPIPRLREVARPKYVIESNGITHHQLATISEISKNSIKGVFEGKAYFLEVNHERSHLDDEFLDCFSIAESPGGNRVMALTERNCDPFDVVCVDENGSEMWRSSIDSASQQMIAATGFVWDRGIIEIAIQGDSVAVFGLNWKCAFCHVFSLSNGKPIARFTTLFTL